VTDDEMRDLTERYIPFDQRTSALEKSMRAFRANVYEELRRQEQMNTAATLARMGNELFHCLDRLHSVLRERHHGRMPDDVQSAYDAAGELLRKYRV
jgi:hypothetical protein